MAAEDDSIAAELEDQRASIESRLAELEDARLFSGDYDHGDAVVTVNAGAGGTDSQDWAEMLLRMLMRWAERRGMKVELKEASPGEEAGIKSATFIARGDTANGLFSAEKGVHRLVRISPFDAARRRHTAFARVEGAPLLQVQNERSQSANKATAMAILKARLLEREEQRRREELAREKGEAQDVGWGSQIRSYVLHPYQMVKDHRTNVEVGDAQRVLDGDLDPFIRAELLRRAGLHSTPPEAASSSDGQRDGG